MGCTRNAAAATPTPIASTDDIVMRNEFLFEEDFGKLQWSCLGVIFLRCNM
jgi:hypothetical protein